MKNRLNCYDQILDSAMQPTIRHKCSHRFERQNDRQGSVLLVVIGLLGMLLLLGIAFYSFASQEIVSSQHFAEASKENDTGSPDKFWDFALEQLIVGTKDVNKSHSALWGRRHALLTGVFGRNDSAFFDGFDLTPYNGTGVHIGYSTTMGSIGDPFIDLDYDPLTPHVGPNYLNFNYSPAANGGVAPTVPTLPAPDTDYTAPDLNSLPLAYFGYGLDSAGNDVRVIIPSFHRPQLLRSGGQPILNWEVNPATQQKILRPHPNHMNVGGSLPRFLSAATTNVLGQTVQPFPFGSLATIKQGVWDLTSAPTLPVPTPVYQWDIDNDGDGTKEGIWMDLDFPVQTLSDGRKYVPLFSFTVVDGDGLVNLNVSGNQLGLLAPSLSPLILGGGRHVSRSNMGLSRSEISPAWALLADPATASVADQIQHNLFWGTASGDITSRREMANVESVFLNIGRPDFSNAAGGTFNSAPVALNYEPNRYYPGRYGELVLMGKNQNSSTGFGMAGKGGGAVANRDFSLVPQPGQSAQLNPGVADDDKDDTTLAPGSTTYHNHVGHSRIDTNGYFFMGTSYLSMQSNTAVPPFVHPLDFWGDGQSLKVGPTGLSMNLSDSGLGGAVQWPYYQNRYSSPGTDTTGSGFLTYVNAGTGNLLAASRTADVDEPDEIISEWEVAATNATMAQDKVFGPDVMFELQGSSSDLTLAGVQGRVRDLAPFNFKASSQADQIRHQFTVLSHDRRNFGLGGMGASSARRTWEFNANADSDSDFEFPPAFVNVAGTSASEPFRQVLRQLLYAENNQTASSGTLSQLRLDLNKLLIAYDAYVSPNYTVNAPVYRELTAHPVVLSNTPISAPTWNADAPTGTPSANDQEYWARYDRQRMARDIYVLLYTLGGGMDGTPYTSSNSTNALYSTSQLKEMAQFAINTVDALDRDEVISKFEYDTNLGDGWSLDDNPYGNDGVPDRAVVYGVEAQKLTFSEVQGIISKKGEESPPGSGNFVDYEATEVNDSDGDRCYTYIELRNVSPFNVDLANGQWQIAVQANNGPDAIPNSGDETDIAQLTLLSGNVTSIVDPGALFMIGTRGGPAATDPMTPANNILSVFRVEATGLTPPDFSTTGTGPATWIVPPVGTALSLDLIPTTAGQPHNNALFRVTDGSGSILGAGADVTTAGNFLYTGIGGNLTSTLTPYIFVLRRRAHPTRTMPVSYSSSAINHVSESQDNPWIEVDRMESVEWKDFLLTGASSNSPTPMMIQTALSGLNSRERAQPFSRGLPAGEANHPAAPASPYRAHTIGSINSNGAGPFNQIQLHFDRDLASVVDLLSIPLYGPDEVTRRVGVKAEFTDSNTTPLTSFLAQERFLRPQLYANLAGSMGAPGPIGDNRWYRLFEFVEVPTQTQSGLHTYPYALRNSGAINLNTLRSRGVLAGLVDDPDNPTSPAIEGHFNPSYPAENAMLVDQFEISRDWWQQFLQSRDGFDPLTNLVLPGTPAGRPFRSLGFMEKGLPSIDDTVLRSLPDDVASAGTTTQFADRRSLFEARNSADRPSSGGADSVDAYTKNRLLRKVVNNSTTRSHVYSVWITTRFFEAVQAPSGEIQIGDALKGTADHRGFFVIDRSLPEQAYQPNGARFDFRRFVQYRKTLQ